MLFFEMGITESQSIFKCNVVELVLLVIDEHYFSTDKNKAGFSINFENKNN